MKFSTNIHKRRLGRTGLMVTELGFGAMNLRLMSSVEAACALVHHVLDHNINLIDTARVYNGEVAPGVMLESEAVVGQVLREREDLTEPIVVITKGHGYTLPELAKDLALSREKLGIEGTGRLSIGKTEVKLVYFLHGISTERWEVIRTSGVLGRLEELKKEGLIHFAGFSSHNPFAKEIREAVDTGVFDVVELPYNVFGRGLGEGGDMDLLKYIHEKDIGIVNMKAFNGNGMPPVYPMLREFIDIDYEKMLKFCLSNPYISTVDAGAKTIEEFDLDVRGADGSYYDEAQKCRLTEEADKVSGLMKNVCRECMHCYEKFQCPNGIGFVDSLAVYSRYLLADSLGRDTRKYRETYGRIEKNGSDCIECGACLEWCEYKLNIPQMMKAAHRTLA